jgi:hypothetical protein
MKATRIKLKETTRTIAWRLVAGTSPDIPLRDGTIEPARPGNNPIRRAAIVSGAGGDVGRPGSASIKEVNLSIAVLPGNRARSAASSQGSTSSRANADRTLRGMPYLSSPTGANRKASNSDPSFGSDVEFTMSLTESAGLPLPLKPSNQQSCAGTLQHRPNSAATSALGLGEPHHRSTHDGEPRLNVASGCKVPRLCQRSF